MRHPAVASVLTGAGSTAELLQNIENFNRELPGDLWSDLEAAGLIQIDPEYGYEFSHTLEEQIAGQLKAGFAMIDFYEAKDEGNRLSQYGSDYLANLSIKL